MNIELLENRRGLYEIWVDKDCIREILRKANEPSAQYKARCEGEFDQYVADMKRLQDHGPKKIKSVTI